MFYHSVVSLANLSSTRLSQEKNWEVSAEPRKHSSELFPVCPHSPAKIHSQKRAHLWLCIRRHIQGFSRSHRWFCDNERSFTGDKDMLTDLFLDSSSQLLSQTLVQVGKVLKATTVPSCQGRSTAHWRHISIKDVAVLKSCTCLLGVLFHWCAQTYTKIWEEHNTGITLAEWAFLHHRQRNRDASI